MNNYRNDIQFLDFSNLDATSKEELTAILTSNTNVENLKLPWEKGNITYEPLVEPIPAQEAPKMWHHFVPDVDANVIKYESHANASSVLVTMPSSIPYGAPIMQPLYQEWPTNVYNISDPNVHTYMQPVYGAASNVYSANTESQEISIRENGRRSSRGRSNSGGNKNYSRNMGHANDIHTNYISDHSQYSIATVPFQPVYCHPDPSMLSPQQHHPNATVQPIYYSHQVYHPPTIPQQQSTHRMDYSPYHQSPTNNVKYSRQTQLLLPNQINGDTMTKTSSITNNNNNTSHIVQSFDKRLQSNNNMSKPTILHTLDDDNNSSQTNIVTTVIVNNSNNHRDSSINEIDDNLPNHINNNGNNNNNFNNNNNNTNNTSNNKKYDFKIEQHYKINENCKGSEKSKVVPCVNIKSSIEVKQNGNDNITKEYDDSVSSLIVKEPSSSYPSSTPITNSSSKITSEEVLNTDVQANEISKTEVEIKKNETCAKNSLEPSVNSETSTTISSSTLTTSTTTTTSANKSWASLLKTGTDSQNVSNNFSKPTALIAPNSSAQTNGNETVIDSKPQNVKNSHKKLPTVSNDIKHKNEVVEQNKSVNNEPSAHCDDPTIYRMGEFLLSYKMEKQTVSLLPRGLTNRSNYCYINSILQALLACPPFYNLLMAMPHSKNPSKHSRSPLLDNMIQFVHEFSLLPEGARLARKDRTQKRSGEAVMDIQCGVPFEPSYVYAILKNTSTPGAFSEEGRQEDAEEFLSCLLNGISDEMLELMKLANSNNQKSIPCNNTNAIQNQDDDDWKIMGPKNKGSITRCTDFGRTPLSDIFRGQLRSRVSRAQEEATDYVQPFFTLQLDVEKAQSVKDALDILVGKDALEGMTCSITNQEIEAWKQLTLEELPVILILHLKWFDYKPDGCSKIVKTVEFPVDLKIDNKLLSLNTKSKLNTKQKTYKLFAVTYHDGKEATKGHYVTDAFHVGYGGWVRYDDSSLKGVSEENVLKPQPPRVPYLLYYRRCDTIGNNQSNNVRNR